MRSQFSDMQESTHRHLMEVDLFAPWILTHDVLPGKKEVFCPFFNS